MLTGFINKTYFTGIPQNRIYNFLHKEVWCQISVFLYITSTRLKHNNRLIIDRQMANAPKAVRSLFL